MVNPRESSLILRKMRIIRWFDSKRRISNLYEESIQDDLWLTLIFRPDIALFKITHLPGWWATLTRFNLIYWSTVTQIDFCIEFFSPFFTIIEHGAQLHPIESEAHFSDWAWVFDHKCHMTGYLWRGHCCHECIRDTRDVVTSLLTPGLTFVMCPAEDSQSGNKVRTGDF